MDPLCPVKHDCNGFSIVKSVPITCDYNVLTLFHDAIENTATATARPWAVFSMASLKLKSVRSQYIQA